MGRLEDNPKCNVVWISGAVKGFRLLESTLEMVDAVECMTVKFQAWAYDVLSRKPRSGLPGVWNYLSTTGCYVD
jgi:hypothetical protein